MSQPTAFNPPHGSRVLRLSLSKKPFDVMVTGEKSREYRRPSEWIKSRLEGREPRPEGPYDFVLFTNGYGAQRPWFAARFEGMGVCRQAYSVAFSNGLLVEVNEGDYIILLGPVAASGNLKPTDAEMLEAVCSECGLPFLKLGTERETCPVSHSAALPIEKETKP